MINIKKFMAVALMGIMAFSAVGCNMIQKTPIAISNTVVAKVGDTKITKGQLDTRLKPLIDDLKKQFGEKFEKDATAKEYYLSEAKPLLEDMILEEMLVQRAKELKITPDEATLEKEAMEQVEKIKASNFQGDEQKFNDTLKDAGYTIESLKKELKPQIIANKVIEHLFKDIAIVDDAIAKYYEEHKDEFTNGPGARLAHILVDTEEKAKEIKAKVDKGQSFAELAKEYGTDGTKDVGGDLGFIEYDHPNYDKDFLAGAKPLKENEVSGPVKSSFGYHLIKATELRTESVVIKLEEVKDGIKAQLEYEKKMELYNKSIEDWKKQYKVTTYEKNII